MLCCDHCCERIDDEAVAFTVEVKICSLMFFFTFCSLACKRRFDYDTYTRVQEAGK